MARRLLCLTLALVASVQAVDYLIAVGQSQVRRQRFDPADSPGNWRTGHRL